MTEQNTYLSKTPRELENLLVYYNSNLRQTQKVISFIKEALSANVETNENSENA